MSNIIESIYSDIAAHMEPGPAIEWDEQSLDKEEILKDQWRFEPDPNSLIPMNDYWQNRDLFDKFKDTRQPAKLHEEHGALIAGALRHRGVDALAFYKSYRYRDSPPFPNCWGIFYLATGIDYIAYLIDQYYPTIAAPAKLATEFLYRHELFHFQADIYTLQLEAIVRRELYTPVRKLFTRHPAAFVEEALANKQAWQWAKQTRIGIEEFARDFLAVQPHAYSRFLEDRRTLAAEWAGITANQTPPGGEYRWDLAYWLEATPRPLLRRSLVPEYVYMTATLTDWLSPAWEIPSVKIIEDNTDVKKKLDKRYGSYRGKWESTKKKLKNHADLPKLNFKPWRQDGRDCWSVRVDKSWRAHLFNEGGGCWTTYKIGPHKEMGHG